MDVSSVLNDWLNNMSGYVWIDGWALKLGWAMDREILGLTLGIA
jgi:hypothetical protein